MKLFTNIRKKFNKKIAVAVCSVVLIVAAPIAATAGWYPERPIKTYDGPGTPGFDHVTFNSFINTPVYGDERAFYLGRQPGGPMQDVMQVQPGQEVTLESYVHNGADPSLNGPNFDGPGVARNTQVRILIPSGTNTSLRSISYISASNASPGTVADTVDFRSSVPFSLSYVPGSATMINNAHPSGLPINDSIVAGGTLVGYNQADGNVPGCFQYDMTVRIRVRVNAASLQFNKQVSATGQPNTWTEQINANPGDTLYYRLYWDNTGQSTVENVTVRDQLASQLELIPGTVRLYNSNFPNGQPLSDTALFTQGNPSGVDVGDYASNANGYVRFQVRIRQNVLPICQQTNLVNTGYIRSDQYPIEISDVANVGVTVGGNCTPPPPPEPGPGGNIPRTGVETPIAGALGTTGIGYGTYAYIKGKKKFRDALRGLIKK